MKTFLRFPLLWVWAALPYVVGCNTTPEYPTEHGQITYFQERHTQYQTLGLDKGDILLVGDDVIDRGIWNRFYNDSRVKNRGIALEGTQCTAYRLPELMESKPSKLFLCTGLYDLKLKKSAVATAEAIVNMVQEAHEISPNTEIYVMSIVPDPKLQAQGEAWVDSAYVVNQRLMKRADAAPYRFLNTTEVMTDKNKVLKQGFTFDGSRINGAGYAHLTRFLEPYIGLTAHNRMDEISNETYRKQYPDMFGHYYSRVSMFNTLPLPEDAIVMLGNSLTNNCWWEEWTENNQVINYGINGDTVEGVLMRLDSLIAAHPKKVFLLISTNNFINDANATPEQVWETYRKILICLRTKTPETELYVISTLPQHPMSPYHEGRNPKAVEINKRLVEYASIYGYTYLDLAAELTDVDGNLDAAYTVDGIHLLPNAYRIWNKMIQPYL